MLRKTFTQGELLESCLGVYAVCAICNTATEIIAYYSYIDQVRVTYSTNIVAVPRILLLKQLKSFPFKTSCPHR